MDFISEIFWIIVSYLFIGYTIALVGSYLILALFSAVEIKEYFRKNSFVDYKVILRSPLAPPISVIAPAFNEASTIVDNVRSLLLLQYPAFEVIIINDGSTDNTLEKLKAHYHLEEVQHPFNEKLKTSQVKAIYRPKDEALHKLLVIDKERGGKADALNAGINIARHDLFCAVDVDSIIERDALLKVVKPFLEDEEVIASGGVLRIANSCKIVDGRIVEVKLPQKFLPRMQTVEYIRTFLLGRMAWSNLNGLLIISGAFGLFNKELVIKAGGYNIYTVTEDLELIVRMRKYMHRIGKKYKVKYIPDPLCWTEVPETLSVLHRQRLRWARGMMETLWMHRDLFFNPRYGKLGMVAYPYWFFFEWAAPIVEMTGYALVVVFLIMGLLNIKMMLGLLAFLIAFAIMYSIIAILSEELTFNQYKNRRELIKMIGVALCEPFGFHQFITWTNFKANFSFFFSKKTWGVMTRIGFNEEKRKLKKEAAANVPLR